MPVGMGNSREVELLHGCGLVSRSRGRTRSLSRNPVERNYTLGVRLSLTETKKRMFCFYQIYVAVKFRMHRWGENVQTTWLSKSQQEADN